MKTLLDLFLSFLKIGFFSFGGTALVIQLAEMGMVLSISRQIPPVKQDR